MSHADERRFIMTDGAAQAEIDYERDTDFCPHGWWGKHKFEARYDLGPSQWRPETYVGFRAEEHAKAYRSKTYVRDICVKCGKTIEREKA